MFVAKSHTLLFTVNFIAAFICILIISGAGLFMLSEEANFMILRKTVKLFEKHVVPLSRNYGNGVGQLIMKITQNLSIAVFTFSISNLLVCIIGLIAIWNQKSTLLRMYQIILGFLLLGHLLLTVGYYFSEQTTEDHLKDYIKGLMTEYVSLRSGTPASLFTASVMVMLNCCGTTYSQSGRIYPKFNPIDAYDNIIYKGINQPIPCCRMNDQLEIINTTCPYEYTIYNSNIGISCDKPFAEEISFYLNIMVFASISVLLINVLMLCIGVKAIKDFNPIKISVSGVMPRTNVRYAFKGLNAITGVICLATLVVCAIAFWSRIPANFLKSEVNKFKVPLNPNSVALQSGLNYYIRSFLNSLLFPTVVTTVSYTSLCVYGFLISYNRNTTYFLIYEVLFSVCLIGHLVLVGMFSKDTSSIRKQAEGVLKKLVFSYESLSSLKPSSLLLGWIMVNLKCCGYIDPYDFLDTKSFSSVDIYDGITYNGLTTPIPCCELNSTYQIIDTGCPLRSSTGPHQYTVGCREVFGNSLVRIVTIFSYSSLLIILLGISMIACCILVLKELWQAL